MNKEHYLEQLKKRNVDKFSSYSYDLLPETFEQNDKIPIKCNLHGVFYQRPNVHLYNCGCPVCGRIKSDLNRRNTSQWFLNKARDKFGNKFDYSKTVYTGQDKEMIVTCPVHGNVTVTPSQHLWLKEGCAQCGREQSLLTGQEKLLERARNHHGDKYDYSKINYRKFDDTVEIICPVHGSFWQSLYDHGHQGIGCPKCARDKDRLTLDQFISKAKSVHGDRYDYSKVVYSVGSEKVTITCKKHGDFIQRAMSHLAGNKCYKCFYEENRNDKEEFVRQARLVHGDKYDYSKSVYRNSKKTVEVICPIHGSFWQKPNSHVSNRSGCPTCCESKGEKAISNFLTAYGIEFIREHRIRHYRYRYDFFLPVLNIYIEYHGQQHYKPVEFFGGQQGFLETRKRDIDKVLLVKQENGHLIVIPYTFLDDRNLERYLIKRLKQIYSCWLIVDKKLTVYKTVMDVYINFSIPGNIPVKQLNDVLPSYKSSASFLF